MLCQKCGLNEATIHLYTAIDGKEKKLNYCQSCYQKIKKLKMEDNLKMAAAGKNPFDSGEWDQLLNLVSKYLSNIRNDKLPFPMKAILAGTNDWENDEPIKVDKHYRRKYMMSNEFLNEFGINITEIARDGGIDPVVGRDAEIQRVIEILNRRTKNNPVLIGEPGVGKTAVVEGLAQKIVNGDVPQKLQGKEIIRLDVASLVQGTGIRGQFEERMQKLIKELIRNNDAILFIDEIHEIVGAGATADNSMDAGNLLKPTLARGEVQLIGATTLNEYRIIEKDAALERRMQPVQVDEPSVEETIAILKGLQKHYEKFHHVSYTDKAIEAAVTLSNRYIQDRFLPDKAIDLLDEAGSKLNLTLSFVDPKDIEEKLEHVKKQKDKATLTEDYETAAYFRDQIKQLQELKDKEVTDQNTPVITEKEMEAIVEKKTSIPVGELKEKEQTQLIHLAEDLKKHLKGQDEAVEKVTKAIRRNRIGLGKQNHPIASFLFIGPTGVGKTELAKQLAFELFGSKDSMIRFDMSE
ncbi:MAG: ATP-dependent Clp protease ATP-binding subunit, partial [Streptococcaceae bacterium]|nr:ATP-dependent Clp protease ATP-binding subunit [Streptococcaceae bacterium]